MADDSNTHISRQVRRQMTFSELPFRYYHLMLVTSVASTNVSTSLDVITARTYLTSALQQHLGLTGTAISIDILKMDGHGLWIRVPRGDGFAVQAALSQWVGKDGNISWRIKGQSEFAVNLDFGDGQDLFSS